MFFRRMPAAAGFIVDVIKNRQYRIVSVSKTFTAASIVLLDQQRTIRSGDRLTDRNHGTIDACLSDTVGYSIPFTGQTTIRQVLSHRAGI